MPQQQIDVNALVERLMAGFEEHVRQQEAAKGNYPGAMQTAGQNYMTGLGNVGTQREQAVAEYEQPYKPGTKDYILAGLSAGLPLASMAMKPGRGRDVVGGAGALAAGVQRGGIQGRRRAKEEGLSLDLTNIGAKEKMLGEGYGVEKDIYETERKAYQWEEEMGLAREREKRLGLPGADKPTWSDLKMKGFGELSGEEQKDALYPGLAPSETGGLTENQRGKNRQQDVINRANMHLYSLDPEVKKRAGIDYDITSFASLAEAAQALAKHRKPTGFMGWGEGEAAPDSTLYDLMIEYMGQGGGQGSKPPDMTDAEWQEYLQMKGQ